MCLLCCVLTNECLQIRLELHSDRVYLHSCPQDWAPLLCWWTSTSLWESQKIPLHLCKSGTSWPGPPGDTRQGAGRSVQTCPVSLKRTHTADHYNSRAVRLPPLLFLFCGFCHNWSTPINSIQTCSWVWYKQQLRAARLCVFSFIDINIQSYIKKLQ